MRCYCCNVILTPQEATRKFKQSQTYADTCNTCLATIAHEVEVTEGNSEENFDAGSDDDERE